MTDKEFARGYTGGATVPEIDYWTGPRIWERIARSNVILSKWFSGMAQAHALRRFHLDLVITRMPAGTPCPLDVGALAARLGDSCTVSPSADGRTIDVRMDTQLTITISDWFRSPAELGVMFLLPEGQYWHPQMPLRTVRVHALLSDEAGRFDIGAARDRIAIHFANALPATDADSWWHILVTGPQAFVFLHDIAKPVLVHLDGPQAIVRVGDRASINEREWAARPGDVYVRRRSPDDSDDVSLVHEATNTVVRVLIDEKVDPLAAFNFHLRQKQIIEELQTQTFRAVENADPRTIEAIRRLCDGRWFVLQSSNNEVFWAYPSDADPKVVHRLEETLQRLGVKILGVDEEGVSTILGNIDTTPGRFASTLTEAERAGAIPMALDRRVFWLIRELPLPARPSRNQLSALMALKAEYEARHGFDLLDGETAVTFAETEIPRLLFDPISLRGSRMLDIGFSGSMVSINLRARESSVLSAEELVDRYARDLDAVCQAVMQRLAEASVGVDAD